MIEISDKKFLATFEAFQKVIVPLENKTRKSKGLPPLTEDEETNLFLELRKRHAVT